MNGRYRINRDGVPLVGGLARDDGWIDMQVQILLDGAVTGHDDFLLGWSVLPPGARHERHLHRNADEFFVVLAGEGHIYTDDGRERSVAGDVVWTPRGRWHGFDNTGHVPVTLVWGWRGADTIESSGYEVSGPEE